MSDNRNNSEFPLMPILVVLALYLGYRIVQQITRFIADLLDGLLIISLGATTILVAFWVYRYITDKQYGETKNLREIEKLERQRKLHTSRLPEHLKEQADEYYIEKQRAFYDMKPHSRVDAMLDRTKQVVSTFCRREK